MKRNYCAALEAIQKPRGMKYVVAVDVGTGSVRSALVTVDGIIVRTAAYNITTWNPKPNFYYQSSADIWKSCCNSIKQVISGVRPEEIISLGFDATCSLVAVGMNGEPISVSPGGEKNHDIILWMDHRAQKETDIINATNHPLLKKMGGKISVEMVTPKLLWIKNNLPRCWTLSQYFFLLPDYLTWRMSGCDDRSLCSVICKCNFEHSSELVGWDEEFFSSIDLHEISANNWKKIGSKIRFPGESCGFITETAAFETGLPVGISIATSIIDAHAGALGTIGSFVSTVPTNLEHRMVAICGTSTCHMVVTRAETFVEGIWGPYVHALVPDMYLLEAGQSAAGKLIDHIIVSHPAHSRITHKLRGRHVTDYLNELLEKMRRSRNLDCYDKLTNNFHMYPDFHGNRSPVADPSLCGMISGLTLSNDEEDLAIKYLATIQALTFSTKHILYHLADLGADKVNVVMLCGGLNKNLVFTQTYANILYDYVVACPVQRDTVLLGSAMLAATAAYEYRTLVEAIQNMSNQANVIESNPDTHSYHKKKFRVYMNMYDNQMHYRRTMAGEDV